MMTHPNVTLSSYLFHRMFALIYLVLGNRIGKKPEGRVSQDDRGVKSVEEMPF